MSTFFNGRELTTPTVASRVDDTGLANRNIATSNRVAFLGRSTKGKPGVPLVFSNPQDAAQSLGLGDLAEAVVKAFAPSQELDGPSQVIALRVNPASQSSIALLDSTAAASVNVVTTDYGLGTTGTRLKIEAATVSGLRVTTRLGQDIYSADDVHRDALTVRYSGAGASATITITGESVVLMVAAAPVATIDLNVAKTVADLVDRINTVPGFLAVLLDANGNNAALNGLDFVTAVDVKTATYTVKADLQAFIDYLNSATEGLLSATRAPGAGKRPALLAETYLTGGTDGTITNQVWADAFASLQTEDIRWLTPLSPDPAIHAMAHAHVQYMSAAGQNERRAIVGGDVGEAIADAKLAAKALNCDRTGRAYGGYYDYGPAGDLVLLPPYRTAALLAAAFSGVSPGTALTNKVLAVQGLEYKLRNPADTDELIKGGLIGIEDSKTGFRVVQSVSTWLANRNYNRVELSTGAALDFTVLAWRAALANLKGQNGDPALLARVISQSDTVLKALSLTQAQGGPGVLVGNDASPPYKGITASIEGDVVKVQAQVSPVIPANYILITVFAVPFSATASA